MALPVSARIVVAQAGFTPPGGYTAGSVDGLALGAEVTCTNQSDAGVIAWTWEVFPAVGQSLGAYGVAGADSPSLALTPPASTGYGDVAVRLTVYGDPLPGGRPNVAVDEAILGVRAPNGVYTPGIPIPHPHESQVGGQLVLDPTHGAQGRLAEIGRALAMGAGGGGGSPTYLRQKSVVGAVGGAITLNASDLDCETVELIDTPAGDVTVTLSPGASLYGRAWRIVNATGSVTRVIKIADGGAGIWLPPGMSRVVGVRTSGTVFPADGMGSSFEFQATIAAPSGTGTVGNNLFLLPAGWVIETVLELVKTAPSGTPTLTTNVGIMGDDFLATGAPNLSGKPRGYEPADWRTGGSFETGWFGRTTDQQISQYWDVTAGDASGGVLVYTLSGRRVTA